jgi:CO/xanthine dehydrogenase Mo-binding subunit
MRVGMRSLVAGLSILLAASTVSAAPGKAHAANTATGTFTLVIQGALFGIGINPSTATVACALPAGTLLANLSAVNGDGNPVTYSLPAGTTDVAISGATLVVASSGFVSTDCGKTIPYSITASQP